MEKEAETALIETYGTLKRLWSFSYKQGRASDGLRVREGQVEIYVSKQ